MIKLSEQDDDMIDFLHFLGVDFAIERESHTDYHLALE